MSISDQITMNRGRQCDSQLDRLSNMSFVGHLRQQPSRTDATGSVTPAASNDAGVRVVVPVMEVWVMGVLVPQWHVPVRMSVRLTRWIF